ncbi:unnamed protein product [Sphagnum jensenii]|uniref:Mitochondrial phosphate carrier protein n=2 Tax=Sphagnum jensenii TaxID=128206 RepID=A0ABP0VI54_9BRYO
MEQTTSSSSWEAKLRGKKLEMFTGKYYAACAAGGMISAGSVHLLITPFDMLKVNMQAYPLKYHSIASSFGTVYREQGMTGIWKGWSSKLFGYGAQGACKFGLYEYFKKSFSDISDPAAFSAQQSNNRTVIYIASSLSAQVIADVALCPFEAVKVRVQTQPGFAKGVSDGFPRLYATEGILGFYKGLLPLWARNIPFSMLMFSSFEHSVDFIYGRVLNRQKSECSMGTQLGVTCMAGYMSGVMGSIVSNPADNIVTALNNNKGITFLQAARNIGIVDLFTRSLSLRVMLVGPLVTAQWFCYDTCKVLCGLPTSGGNSEKRAQLEAL